MYNICGFNQSKKGKDLEWIIIYVIILAGKMNQSAWDYPRWDKFPQEPYNKSFIDQACWFKMAGYWPCSFLCEFMDLDFVSIHKHAKKELGQYPAILTSHLANNPYLWDIPLHQPPFQASSSPTLRIWKCSIALLFLKWCSCEKNILLRKTMYKSWPFYRWPPCNHSTPMADNVQKLSQSDFGICIGRLLLVVAFYWPRYVAFI